MDNHKLVTISNFCSKYVKDAKYIFLRKICLENLEIQSYAQKQHIFFCFFNNIFFVIFFKIGMGLTQPNGSASQVGPRTQL